MFLTVGVIALGYAAYVVAEARVYQRNAAIRFEQERTSAAVIDAEASLIVTPAKVVPVPADGESIGQMVIARLGLDVMFVQGESPTILERAVGHLRATALPGVIGNVGLAGHRDSFFRPLKDVRVGDKITLKTTRGDYNYVVDLISIVKPTDVEVLDATGGETLTLITCFPFYYVGAAPSRFIVRGTRQAP